MYLHNITCYFSNNIKILIFNPIVYFMALWVGTSLCRFDFLLRLSRKYSVLQKKLYRNRLKTKMIKSTRRTIITYNLIYAVYILYYYVILCDGLYTRTELKSVKKKQTGGLRTSESFQIRRKLYAECVIIFRIHSYSHTYIRKHVILLVDTNVENTS